MWRGALAVGARLRVPAAPRLCRSFAADGTVAASPPPPSYTLHLNKLLSGHTEAAGDLIKAVQLDKGKPPLQDLTAAVTALVGFLQPLQAVQLLEAAGAHAPALRTAWHTLLQSYLKVRRLDRVQDTVARMVALGVPLDIQLMLKVVSAHVPRHSALAPRDYSAREDLPKMTEFIGTVKKSTLLSTTALTALRIMAHGCSGNVEEVEKLLGDTPQPDALCLSAAFASFLTKSSLFRRAAKIHEQMAQAGLKPTFILYDALATAYDSSATRFEERDALLPLMRAVGMPESFCSLKSHLESSNGTANLEVMGHLVKEMKNDVHQSMPALVEILGCHLEYYTDEDHKGRVETVLHLVDAIDGASLLSQEASEAVLRMHCRAGALQPAERVFTSLATHSLQPQTQEALAQLVLTCGVENTAFVFDGITRLSLEMFAALSQSNEAGPREKLLQLMSQPGSAAASGLLSECAARQQFAAAGRLLELLEQRPEVALEPQHCQALAQAMAAARQREGLVQLLREMKRRGIPLPEDLVSYWASQLDLASDPSGEHTADVQWLVGAIQDAGIHSAPVQLSLIHQFLKAGLVDDVLAAVRKLREQGGSLDDQTVYLVLKAAVMQSPATPFEEALQLTGPPTVSTLRWLVGHLVSKGEVERASSLAAKTRDPKAPPDPLVSRLLYDAFRQANDMEGAQGVLADLGGCS